MNIVDPMTVDEVVPNAKLGISDRSDKIKKGVAALIFLIGLVLALKMFVFTGESEKAPNPLGITAVTEGSPTDPVATAPASVSNGDQIAQAAGGYVPVADPAPAPVVEPTVSAAPAAVIAQPQNPGVVAAPATAQVQPIAQQNLQSGPVQQPAPAAPLMTATAPVEQKVVSEKPRQRAARKVAKKVASEKPAVKEAAKDEAVSTYAEPVEEAVTTEEILVIR